MKDFGRAGDPQFLETLNEYLDGVLTEEECAAVERRLAESETAREDYRALLALHESLAALRREPPATLHGAVMAAVEGEKAAARRSRFRVSFRFAASAAAALLVALLLPAVLRGAAKGNPTTKEPPFFCADTSGMGILSDPSTDSARPPSPVEGSEEKLLPPTGGELELPKDGKMESEQIPENSFSEVLDSCFPDGALRAPSLPGEGRLHLVFVPSDLPERLTARFPALYCGRVENGALFSVSPELRRALAAEGVPDTVLWNTGDQVLLCTAEE